MLLVVQITQIMDTMFSLFLISLSASAVYSGVTIPGSGLPQFSIVGYLDDQQTELYTSDIGKTIPKATWVKKERPDQWLRKTLTSKANEELFRHEVKIVMNRFNQTEGLHIVQVLHSCELKDDGSIENYEEFRYDGKEYMHLDTKTGTFIPTMAEAQITTERWNSPDVRAGETVRNYLRKECIDRLKRYIEYAREDLERRVRPEVKVTSRESDGVTKLHCQVYGFHPRAVDVKWMKNGIDQVPSYQTTHVLPNPDGTYQIRVAVDVIPQDGDSYSCYVDHSSLKKPIMMKWEPKEPNQDSLMSVIISVAIITFVLTSVISGVILYRKKKSEYIVTATHETTTDTNSSVEVNNESSSS